MFQYAAARRLAEVHRTSLKLDVYSYSQNQYFYSVNQTRRYGLGHFNIQADLATWREITRLSPLEGLQRSLRSCLGDKLSHLAVRALNKAGIRSPYYFRTDRYDPAKPLPKLMVGRVVSERLYHFDPGVLDCPNDVCLTGYWQSDKYFKDISEIIRRELTVKTPLQGQNLEVARQIQACESVSLHVRRGDKAKQAHHFATTVEYCKNVVKYFRARLPRPQFFVFSDDCDWARENLADESDLVFVTHNADEANYEDLRLMSLCKHNSMAPSSFSWWGAWLNQNPDKIVLRPRALFNMSNHDTKDACPPDWLVLD